MFVANVMHADNQLEEIAYLRLSEGFWQVWVTDTKGSHHRQITFDAVDKTRISWSPDKLQLLVNTNAGNLVVVGVKSLMKRDIKLDSLEVFDAQWSTDGQYIAYTSTTSLQADNAEVWVARIDGSEKRKVTSNTAVTLSPTWNPKRGSIVFSAGLPGKNQELWEVFPDTGKSEQLTVAKTSSMDPSVNHEGKILYSSDQAGSYAIWLLDEEMHKRKVTMPSGYDAQPSWSRDGKSFAFFRISGKKKQVWVYDFASATEIPITPENVLSRTPSWAK